MVRLSRNWRDLRSLRPHHARDRRLRSALAGHPHGSGGRHSQLPGPRQSWPAHADPLGPLRPCAPPMAAADRDSRRSRRSQALVSRPRTACGSHPRRRAPLQLVALSEACAARCLFLKSQISKYQPAVVPASADASQPSAFAIPCVCQPQSGHATLPAAHLRRVSPGTSGAGGNP